MMANLRLVLAAEVVPGNQHTSKHSSPRLWELLDSLPAAHRPYLIRGDVGFGNEPVMREAERRRVPLPTAPTIFWPSPYRFVNREYLIIAYRTDPAKLRALVPEPLVPDGDNVRYEFMRMPDSTGFGDYTETGQVIPVTFRGRKGGYSHSMFLNDGPPIAGGRELWGFPKKLAQPSLRAEIDTLVGALDYGPVRVATGTMGYKYKAE